MSPLNPAEGGRKPAPMGSEKEVDMTRKDYERFAVALHLAREDSPIQYENVDDFEHAVVGFDYAVRTMALVMKQENPRFDEQRFYAAVGMEG